MPKGFKETEIGAISADWELVPLRQAANSKKRWLIPIISEAWAIPL
jgi:hypothetical protein